MPRRRPRGEGSIYQRKDGLWHGRLSLPPARPGALRKRESVYARTQVECAKKLARAIAEHNVGIEPPKDYTVSDMLDAWLKERKGEWKESTIITYDTAVRKYIKPWLGHVLLKDLTRKRCRNFLKQIHETGTANKRNTQHTVLHTACNWACENDLMETNPLQHVRKAKHDVREAIIWSAKEVELFLSVVDDPMYYTLFRLYLATGIRRGEAAGLKWESVNLEGGFIVIKQQARDLAREVKIIPPKSKSANRQIPIARKEIQLLWEHKSRQTEQLGEMEYVFTNQTGGLLSPNAVYSRFKRLIKKAGPGLRPTVLHDLRKWNISHKVNDPDLDIATVTREAGHASSKLTLDTYTKVIPSDEAPLVKTLEDYGVGKRAVN